MSEFKELMEATKGSARDMTSHLTSFGGAFATGAEVLMLSGRDYIPPEDVEFVVEEIDD